MTEVVAADTDEAALYKNMRKTVNHGKKWFLAHHEAPTLGDGWPSATTKSAGSRRWRPSMGTPGALLTALSPLGHPTFESRYEAASPRSSCARKGTLAVTDASTRSTRA